MRYDMILTKAAALQTGNDHDMVVGTMHINILLIDIALLVVVVLVKTG